MDRKVDRYFGFESDGEYKNWRVKSAMSTDTINQVGEFIDRFTAYDWNGESNSDFADVGQGRFRETGDFTITAIPKGVSDDDAETMAKSMKITDDTTFEDIYRRFGRGD